MAGRLLLHVALLALVASAAASVAGAAWRCSTDASCQLNGVCVDGKCRCDPQWIGFNCSRLNTGVSKPAYLGMSNGQTTWGGHPV